VASILDVLSLSDRYEIKARFLPGLITASVFLPAIAVVNSEAFGFLTGVSLAAAVGAAGAFLLAYLASALGGAYERSVWPRRPHDLPTNRWLHPSDTTVSRQQKERWHATIKEHLGLDIPAAAESGDAEQERVINDAVRALRGKFRDLPAGNLLQVHNEDYGFVRNLTGLRVVWLPAAVASTAVTWTAYATADAAVVWGIAATGILALAVVCHSVLPPFVPDRALRYAESFFGALSSLETT